MAEPPAGSLLVRQRGPELAEALLRNPLNLNEIDFNKHPVLPLQDLSRPRVREIYEKIVTDVFSAVSMSRENAGECWQRCVSFLQTGNLLLAMTFTTYDGYNKIKEACINAMSLPRTPEQIPCLPAPILVSLIASINYRKVAASMPDNSVMDMLGTHCSVSWLKVAIQVYDTTRQSPFLVARDDSLGTPTTEQINGVWIVRAPQPPPNRYLAVVHRELAILRVAPEFGDHLMDADETLEQAFARISREIEEDDDFSFSTEPPAEFHTVTMTITREQALAKAGGLPDRIQNPLVKQESLKAPLKSWIDYNTFRVLPRELKAKYQHYAREESQDLINKFLSTLYVDITVHSWEEQVPGEKIEMLDSGVAEPSLKVLEDCIKNIPKNQDTRYLRRRVNEALRDLKNIFKYHHMYRIQQYEFMEKLVQTRMSPEALEQLKTSMSYTLRDVFEALKQLKISISHTIRDEFEAQKVAPQDIVDDFKAVYALFRNDGLAIPQELHSITVYSLTREQHREVTTGELDQEMGED
ncbi:hypothetical protein IL306_007496 [Fusarium sp. DS 682]|nr:hypothetical protein IL306_007496 [Fusarium sp. DS 682]